MRDWITHNRGKLLLAAIVAAASLSVLCTAAIVQACRLVQEHFDY